MSDPSIPASRFGDTLWTLGLRVGCLIMLALSGLPAAAQVEASLNAQEVRRRAFEVRYREAVVRGEAEAREWQDRYEARLQADPVQTPVESRGETPTQGSAAAALSDRDALIALFQSTGGTGWFSRANWGSSLPIEQWSDVVVENGRVVKLTLSDNNLAGPLPQEIGDLTALRELELDGNRISGSLPSSMSNLSALKRLTLDANRITGSLPQGLGTLPGLERLLLDDNLLEDLPDLSGASPSLVLTVRRNRLTFEDIEPSVGIFDFRYAPQLPVGELKTSDVSSGSSVSFQVPVGGANNRYRWVRNGVAIPGATSDTYAIPSASTADAGVYVLEITNAVATRPGASYTNLVLRSQPLSLRVDGSGPTGSPVAAADSVRTPVNTSVVIDVLANDVDPEGDALTVTGIERQPGHGTATVNLNSTITYLPQTDFEGEDSFEYRVEDTEGNAASASVFVRVGSAEANRAPVAHPDTAVTDVGVPVVIAVLENDFDPDGDALSLSGITEPPAHGTAVIEGDQTIIYTPEPGFSGEDGFSYTISDGFLSASARVVVRVGALPNQPPVAQDDTAETTRDAAVVIEVLANDSDPDGDALTVTGFAEMPANGSATILVDGTVEYQPDAGFIGTDTFVYTISDGVLSASARVTVTVSPPPNPSPIAADDFIQTERDIPVDVDVLANDSDPNGDALTIVGVGVPLFGSAVTAGSGLVRFTPAAGYSGPDSFTYQISDGTSTASARVSVSVIIPEKPNRSPVANPDRAVTNVGTPIHIAVLENDSDLDGDPLSIVAVTLAGNGSTAVEDPQTVRYTPKAGFSGEDSFSYQITDGKAGAVGRVDVLVTLESGGQINVAPAPKPDAVFTPFAASVEIDVLANDVEPDGAPPTLTGVVREPSYGRVEVASPERLRYTPHVGFLGTDVFEYGVSDGTAVAKAAVTVDVVPHLNAVPIAGPDFAETTTRVPVVVDVLDNDIDPDGDALVLLGITGFPQFGTVTLNTDHTVTYEPNVLLVAGIDRFEYEMSDGTDRARAEVTITVSPPGNRAPRARDDEGVTRPGVPVEIDVLANDTDPDGDVLSVQAILVAPYSGTATILSGGLIRYAPNASLGSGTDQFIYQVSDGLVPASARVTVRITPAQEPSNSAPVAVDDEATTPRDAPVDIPLLSNDADPNGDPLSVVGLGLPRHGEAVLLGNGVVRYTPAAGFSGNDAFAYQISDGQSTAKARVAVTVTAPEPRNRAPVAYDDFAGTTVNSPVQIDVLRNDADLDGDPLMVSAVTLAGNGVVVVNDGRTVTYTPNSGFVGSDSFTYQVTDGRSGDIGGVTVTVSASGAINRAPVARADRLVTLRGRFAEVDVLANDADPDGDNLSVVGVFRDPSSGRVSLFGSGRLVYTPNAGFAGYDRIDYGITDGINTSRGVVHIEVQARINRVPIARNDAIEVPAGSAFALDVLANDEDPDGDPLTVLGLTEFPSHGLVIVTDTGTILYTPVADYAGFDGYSYKAGDGMASAEAHVEISVYAPIPVLDDLPASTYSLGANYPNPFNPITFIPFSLPSQSHVRMDVFDLTGRRITTLMDEIRPAGAHVARFDGGDLSSGVYLYIMRSGDFSATGKLILIK